MYDDTEALRRKLLNETYAGAFSGLGAMLLDADEIRNVAPGNWRKLHGGRVGDMEIQVILSAGYQQQSKESPRQEISA